MAAFCVGWIDGENKLNLNYPKDKRFHLVFWLEQILTRRNALSPEIRTTG
ncbi:protein of unknown function [Pseudodesulfovibrio profundus]|uniref:Uncharacterized protein n=1 Tax=Pseudodesulfovibrio profundus TaxID=57320 RepID=A0A2C8F8K3_9BACT|nr:protein of unknown function [Pseudodesulfovibrio profundus]